jgi:hypothetical protein
MDDPEPGRRPLATRMIVGFGHFWWEFLVGDTPELLVGVVIILGLTAWLCVGHSYRTSAALILPLLVVGVLGTSVRWASRRGRS